MVDSSTTSTAALAVATAPSVSGSQTVDWGSWAAQGLHAIEKTTGALAGELGAAALATLPYGAIISTFVGPKLIDQYVEQAIHNLEGIVSKESFEISNPYEIYVFNAMKKYEQPVFDMLGNDLAPMIAAAVAKFLPGSKLAT
jgi:hypothetical protein